MKSFTIDFAVHLVCSDSYFIKSDGELEPVGYAAAEELRRLHAENESLKLGIAKQANAVTLMRSVSAENAKHNAEQNVIVELSQLRSQLESEREANSQLTADISRLAEIEQAAIKLVKCKGRYHTEQNMVALAKLVGVTLQPVTVKDE